MPSIQSVVSGLTDEEVRRARLTQLIHMSHVLPISPDTVDKRALNAELRRLSPSYRVSGQVRHRWDDNAGIPTGTEAKERDDEN
jgi:hypothetical protein